MELSQNLIRTILRNPNAITSTYLAKQFHAQILKIKGTFHSDNSILLSIYSNLNHLHDSVRVFDSLQSPPALAWKSIIRCYTFHGLSVQSMASFNEMRAWGINPNKDFIRDSQISRAVCMEDFEDAARLKVAIAAAATHDSVGRVISMLAGGLAFQRMQMIHVV
ncbi:hypothetical protein K1719_038766 [Acacia pycnantha]|nr:hypothetical protein K1719_038766 [Acacia pycnantha]